MIEAREATRNLGPTSSVRSVCTNLCPVLLASHVVSVSRRSRTNGRGVCVGEYVAFLDSDDIWFPWTLSSFAEVIGKHSRPDLVSCKLELFWEDRQLKRIQREPLRVHVFADYYASSRNRYFVGACMMTLK